MTMAAALVVLILLLLFAWSHRRTELEPQPPLHASLAEESPRYAGAFCLREPAIPCSERRKTKA